MQKTAFIMINPISATLHISTWAVLRQLIQAKQNAKPLNAVKSADNIFGRQNLPILYIQKLENHFAHILF